MVVNLLLPPAHLWLCFEVFLSMCLKRASLVSLDENCGHHRDLWKSKGVLENAFSALLTHSWIPDCDPHKNPKTWNSDPLPPLRPTVKVLNGPRFLNKHIFWLERRHSVSEGCLHKPTAAGPPRLLQSRAVWGASRESPSDVSPNVTPAGAVSSPEE